MSHHTYPSFAAAISSCLQARVNCLAAFPVNTEWAERHSENLSAIARELPRGSGIDRGTSIDLDASRANRLVLTCDVHRMDANGYYAGWLTYQVIVCPGFQGLEIDIKGRNTPDDLKSYLHAVYYHALSQPVTHSANGWAIVERA